MKQIDPNDELNELLDADDSGRDKDEEDYFHDMELRADIIHDQHQEGEQ